MIIDHEQLSLQPALVEMVKIFNTNQHQYVSTINFLQQGIISPAAGISRLKDKGAIIEKITRTEIDGFGIPHKKIACYKIVGWII